jgi:hypothetical protein
MTEERTLEEVYAIVQKAVPEPGINKPAVMAMLKDAHALGEGPVMYFAQMTATITRDVFSKQHTFHSTISDYDFSKRLHDALRESQQI